MISLFRIKEISHTIAREMIFNRVQYSSIVSEDGSVYEDVNPAKRINLVSKVYNYETPLVVWKVLFILPHWS